MFEPRKPKNKPLKPKAKPLSEEEIDVAYKRMIKQCEQVDEGVSTFEKKTGLDPEKVKGILDNPLTFSKKDEWKKVQSQREYFKNKVWEDLGKETTKKAKIQKDLKTQQKRKGKTLGGRMRNWLSMQ